MSAVPLYDFTCKACGGEFEELTSSHAVPPRCPTCGAESQRRFSPVAPRLSWGLRGRAARKSDARRAEREAGRRGRFTEQRKKRREGG